MASTAYNVKYMLLWRLKNYLKCGGAGAFLFLLAPLFARAQTLQSFVEKIYENIFNPFVLLVGALALIIFLWGVIEFIARSDSDEAVGTGKRHMVWGIIGLLIILSVWGIMNLICRT